jgi:hypothetical protein
VIPACERATERRKIRALRQEQEAKKAAERAARAEEAKANNLKVTVDDSSSSINTSVSHSDISEVSKDHTHSKHSTFARLIIGGHCSCLHSRGSCPLVESETQLQEAGGVIFLGYFQSELQLR